MRYKLQEMMRLSSRTSTSVSFNHFRAALFHSTPISDKKRRVSSDSGTAGWYSYRNSSRTNNSYAKRFRKREARRTVLRNLNAFTDGIYESWEAGENECPSSRWFRQHWGRGPKRNASCGFEWGSCGGNGSFQFCYSENVDIETIFRSAFGGGNTSWYSFSWRNSSGDCNKRNSWNWKYRIEFEDTDDEDDHSSTHYSSKSVLASDRRTLGLSASGPLKLDDVKRAYRACALKWHPDRHQGSAKVEAEETFKRCSAAYKSLCDQLATA